MLNFDFLEKGLGKVSPPYFVHIFQYFKILCIFLWILTDQISMSDCLSFLQYLYCNCLFPRFTSFGNFGINLLFLIRLFFYMTEKPKQKFEYLKNEKSFQGEIKSIFDHFKKDFHLPKIS